MATATATGSMVRISSLELPMGRTTGVLERVTGDSIIVSGRAISRAFIRRFEVSTGHRSNVVRGMTIGFGSGAAVGALGCLAVCGTTNADDLKGVLVAIAAGVGGVAGLGIGAAIGSKKTEHWRTSSLSTLRISPIARSHGALGVAVGFQF